MRKGFFGCRMNLPSLYSYVEAYPALQANMNYMYLQQELSRIEDKIAFSRQF